MWPLLLFCALAPVLISAGQQESQARKAPGWSDMPDVIRVDPPFSEPRFVAADVVVKSDGSINDEVIPADYREDFEALLAGLKSGSCDEVVGRRPHDESGEISSLSEAVEQGDNVFVGEVVGEQPGFASGWRPGMLLRVEVGQVLKGVPARNDYFVFIPSGSFKVGGKKICRSNPAFVKPPKLGNELLVIYDDNWFNDRSPLLATGSYGLISLERGGSATLPRRLMAKDPELRGASRARLIEFVEAVISRELDR